MKQNERSDSPGAPLIGPPAVLTGCLSVVVTAPFLQWWVGFIILFILILGIALAGQIGIGRLNGAIVRMWPFFVFALLIHVVSSAVSPADPAQVTGSVRAAAMSGAVLLARLVCVILAGSLVMMVYPAQVYGRWLSGVTFPGRWVRRRQSQVALVVSLALGFIPTLSAEAERIRLAWKARGLPEGTGRLAKFRALERLLFPLLVAAFRRADQTALALQARGYDPGVTRTQQLQPTASAVDRAAMMIVPITCAALLVHHWWGR